MIVALFIHLLLICIVFDPDPFDLIFEIAYILLFPQDLLVPVHIRGIRRLDRLQLRLLGRQSVQHP